MVSISDAGSLDTAQWNFDLENVTWFAAKVQGGSDKSGIFFFFLLNGTTPLKISRFY
jgi:hypothetical protein